MRTHYEGLLAVIRADIAVVEPKVTKLKRLLQPLETDLLRLRDMEAYLVAKCESAKETTSIASQPSQPPTTQVTTSAQASEQVAAQATQAATVETQGDAARIASAVGHVEIMNAALSAARTVGVGRWIRAGEVAKKLIPTYEAESDERAFENRIFSLISRKEEFTRIGRGKFALTEFVREHPERYPELMLAGTNQAAG
jgi:hypothetical protein